MIKAVNVEKMSNKDNEPTIGHDLIQKETFFSHYIKQRKMFLSLLLSMFLLLDIVTLFVITNYTFTDIFLYFGILMILIAIGTLAFIYFEENYLWAILGSLILGVTPLIESIIVISKSITGLDLGLAIITLILGFILSILPMLLVYLKLRFGKKKIEE